MSFAFIWSLPDDPPDDWEPRIPLGSATGRLTRVTIEGNPTIHVDLGIDGVFVAGDVRARSIKRVASAVGEGSMAVSLIHQYLAEG